MVDVVGGGEQGDVVLSGDLDGLLAILAPDVAWTTDSRGKVTQEAALIFELRVGSGYSGA